MRAEASRACELTEGKLKPAELASSPKVTRVKSHARMNFSEARRRQGKAYGDKMIKK